MSLRLLYRLVYPLDGRSAQPRPIIGLTIVGPADSGSSFETHCLRFHSPARLQK
jgi:hypothetical protein